MQIHRKLALAVLTSIMLVSPAVVGAQDAPRNDPVQVARVMAALKTPADFTFEDYLAVAETLGIPNTPERVAHNVTGKEILLTIVEYDWLANCDLTEAMVVSLEQRYGAPEAPSMATPVPTATPAPPPTSTPMPTPTPLVRTLRWGEINELISLFATGVNGPTARVQRMALSYRLLGKGIDETEVISTVLMIGGYDSVAEIPQAQVDRVKSAWLRGLLVEAQASE